MNRCNNCLRYMETRILFTSEEEYCPHCEGLGPVAAKDYATLKKEREEVTEKIVKCSCFTDSMGAWNMCDTCSNLNASASFGMHQGV